MAMTYKLQFFHSFYQYLKLSVNKPLKSFYIGSPFLLIIIKRMSKAEAKNEEDEKK